MGLAERRSVKLFQDDKYTKIKSEIDAAAGFPVEVDVAWDTIAASAEGRAPLLEDSLPKVYFMPIIEAFRAICVDDLGRESLKSGLKKVIVRASGTKELSFRNGVLLIDHNPVSNVDYWGERKKELQEALEQGL